MGWLINNEAVMVLESESVRSGCCHILGLVGAGFKVYKQPLSHWEPLCYRHKALHKGFFLKNNLLKAPLLIPIEIRLQQMNLREYNYSLYNKPTP